MRNSGQHPTDELPLINSHLARRIITFEAPMSRQKPSFRFTVNQRPCQLVSSHVAISVDWLLRGSYSPSPNLSELVNLPPPPMLARIPWHSAAPIRHNSAPSYIPARERTGGPEWQLNCHLPLIRKFLGYNPAPLCEYKLILIRTLKPCSQS